jgi:hypothetical protein
MMARPITRRRNKRNVFESLDIRSKIKLKEDGKWETGCMTEKRAYPRKPCFIAVDYVSGGHLSRDFIVNISAGGVLIETHRPSPVREMVSMTFELPLSRAPIKIKGQVVRIESTGIGVGFRFFEKGASRSNGFEGGDERKSFRTLMEEVRQMGKVKQRKVRWNPSASDGLLSYRLYWSVGECVDYSSDHADLGMVTDVVLPDDIPSFPWVSGEVELGITAVSQTGNESDMTKVKTHLDFMVPRPPMDLVVEDL